MEVMTIKTTITLALALLQLKKVPGLTFQIHDLIMSHVTVEDCGLILTIWGSLTCTLLQFHSETSKSNTFDKHYVTFNQDNDLRYQIDKHPCVGCGWPHLDFLFFFLSLRFYEHLFLSLVISLCSFTAIAAFLTWCYFLFILIFFNGRGHLSVPVHTVRL